MINNKTKNNNCFGKCKWIHTLIITYQSGFHWLKSFAFGLVLQKVICFDRMDLFWKKSCHFVMKSKVKPKPNSFILTRTKNCSNLCNRNRCLSFLAWLLKMTMFNNMLSSRLKGDNCSVNTTKEILYKMHH